MFLGIKQICLGRGLLINWDNPVAQSIKATTTAYAEQVKQAGRDHKLGAPFLHAWGALLRGLGQCAQVEGAVKTTLEAYWNAVISKAQNLELLADTVKHCRLSKTHNAKVAKLQFAVAVWQPDGGGMALEEAVMKAMMTIGGHRRNGAPPKSALARDAQRILDLLKEEH
ncbi:unnamed protein product [Prorocentrum cordatum]|uniref:Uncharacterized protein n=1 Tax=Prorocentrum cordatum TaxID=2364126 RepID=A0ABN9X8P9_9DINO|nr:unnamed protein product [Polarella glacialis]